MKFLKLLRKFSGVFFKNECEHKNRELVESSHCSDGYEGSIHKCHDCGHYVKQVTRIHWDGMTGSPGFYELKSALQGKLFHVGASF